MSRPENRATTGQEDEQKLGGVPGHLQAAVQQLMGQPPVAGKPKADATNDGGESTDRAPAWED